MSPIEAAGWVIAAGVLAATSGVPGDDWLVIWERLQSAWASGNGLALVMFIAVVLLFTGRVVSGRDATRRDKDWETRYKENDDRWRERYQEQKARADSAEHTLYQLMGYQARTVAVAERTATAAEVAATVVATAPPPLKPPGPAG